MNPHRSRFPIFTTTVVLLVLAYSWAAVALLGPQPILANLTALTVIGICVAKAVKHRNWGLDYRHFLPALYRIVIWTVPALLLIVALGSTVSTFQPRTHPGRDFAFLFLWALGQQFALQTTILEEFTQRLNRKQAILCSAGVFAVLHLPNPFLTPVTFLSAWVWCSTYSRHPNILPLALSHVCGTLTVLQWLDRSITGGLRVGYGYLLLGQ